MAFAATFLITCIWKKNKKNKKKTTSPPQSEPSSSTVDSTWSFHSRVQLSMDEIAKATNNFASNLIVGRGSFGVVYKACLSSGIVVAIKKLSPNAFHRGIREFQAEVETLGKLRHRNIVKILGSLASGTDRLLVYEFVERGSLDRWLHLTGEDDVLVLVESLPWEIRVKIIRDVAKGLRYLHGLEKPIIHRDIKPSNVLLDSKFEARIADFGLARMIASSNSHVSSQFVGSRGYLAPEYSNGMTVATAKMDVYSFGVLMLETVTGHQPNSPVISGNKELGLVKWAMETEFRNGHMELVDPNITRMGGISEASVKEYIRIACMCCSELQKDRPTMTEVVDLLDRKPM